MSAACCRHWCESQNISFIRFNPLLEEELPVPETAGVETLINIVIQTMSHIATDHDGGQEQLKAIKDIVQY